MTISGLVGDLGSCVFGIIEMAMTTWAAIAIGLYMLGSSTRPKNRIDPVSLSWII